MLTLGLVYAVILAGGIVRGTGAGMGCPDWPTCFGYWIPPTQLEQLPENYKEFYSQYRHRKNERFAAFLMNIGMKETANKIMLDASILVEDDFNPGRTWTEYVNRLVGVISGICVMALVFFSFSFRKVKPLLWWVSGLILGLMLVQGWFGSIVVSTNLTPWTVTVHMVLALVIVGLLVMVVFYSGEYKPTASSSLFWLSWLALIVLVIQILLGTSLREEIDLLGNVDRNKWIEMVGVDFFRHRTYSWLLLITLAPLVFKLFKYSELKQFGSSIGLFLMMLFASGVGMAYGGVPPYLQPLHLLVGSLLFGVIFFLLFLVRRVDKESL